jgi:hypothetical protein
MLYVPKENYATQWTKVDKVMVLKTPLEYDSDLSSGTFEKIAPSFYKSGNYFYVIPDELMIQKKCYRIYYINIIGKETASTHCSEFYNYEDCYKKCLQLTNDNKYIYFPKEV